MKYNQKQYLLMMSLILKIYGLILILMVIYYLLIMEMLYG